MEAWVFFYQMKGLEAKTRTKVLEQLFGKAQKSNHGRYQYQIKGKIPEGDYIKPVRAALIIKKEHVSLVTKLFDTYRVKYRLCEIKLQEEDFHKKEFL